MEFITSRYGSKKRRYILSDVIGTGGFSIVYRAYDRQLGCDVAIKVADRSKENPAEHEEHIGRHLAHPHVIRQLDAFKTRKYHYIVYELLRGRELFEHIVANDHLNEGDARTATSALVDALLYLHVNGIIHRDLKPENILFRDLGGPMDNFVIADFGLSAHVSDDPDDVVIGHAGSPGYTAPELLEGRGAGRPADMWSLGLVVYAMLSGRTPFVATDPVALNEECRRAQIAFPARYWQDISPMAHDFVSRCLQRDPHRRMTAFEALHHPWLAAGLSTSSSETSLHSALFERRASDASSCTSLGDAFVDTVADEEKTIVAPKTPLVEMPTWFPM